MTLLQFLYPTLSWYWIALIIIVVVVLLAIAAYKFFMWLIEQWP